MPEQWQPGFHDHGIVAWLITAGYLVAAGFCLILGKRYRPDKTAVVWFSIAASLIFLCLNKQLDLQSWLRLTGRDFTQAHGLYQFKLGIRYAFMAALFLGVCIPLALFRLRLWALIKRAPVGTAGLALIGFFILIRGANYDGPLFPYAKHWIIEASGLALVLGSFGGRVVSGESR